MAHPGFKAVQKEIAEKQGVSDNAAGAMLAKSSRMASEGAKRRNPKLRKVKGEAISRRLANLKKSKDG